MRRLPSLRIRNENKSREPQQQQQQHNGEAVVYVLDSGIMRRHAAFRGVTIERLFPSNLSHCNETQLNDTTGHGTYVSSIVARVTDVSVTTIVAVEIMCGEVGVAGTLYGLQRGLEVSLRHYLDRHANKQAFMLLSLSVDVPSVLNEVLDLFGLRLLRRTLQMVRDAGIVMVVAAGNHNEDACKMELPRAAADLHSGMLVVGSTSSSLDCEEESPPRQATFSNFGACVDIWAPGIRIRGAGIASKRQTIRCDGTSASAALVLGEVVKFWKANPTLSNQQVVDWFSSRNITKQTSSNMVDDELNTGLTWMNMIIDCSDETNWLRRKACEGSMPRALGLKCM